MRFITRLLFYRSMIKIIDAGCFGDLLLVIERVYSNSGKRVGMNEFSKVFSISLA
jgi:hypothetical protein